MAASPPPMEDSRERRRRQNRESQRRWRERCRREKKNDDVPTPIATPPALPCWAEDRLLGSASPSLLSLLHSPSLEAQDLNGYFGQHGQWGDQTGSDNPPPHIAWPPMDVDFCYPMQQQTENHTHSPNDEIPRDDSSANGYPKLDRLSVSTTSIPALLTPPTSTTSTSRTTKSCPRRHKDSSTSAPTTSPAEEIIRDTQELYRVGVKAGFLKQDDKVQHYLAAMRRVYQKVPSLMDEDYEGSSGATEDDEDEDDDEEEDEEEEMHRLKGAGRSCPCGKAH